MPLRRGGTTTDRPQNRSRRPRDKPSIGRNSDKRAVLRRKSEANRTSSATDSPDTSPREPQRMDRTISVVSSGASTGRARWSRTWKRGRILRCKSRHFSKQFDAMNRHNAPSNATSNGRGPAPANLQSAPVNPGSWHMPNGTMGLSPLAGMPPTALMPVIGQPGTSSQSKEIATTNTNTKIRKPYTITKERERWTDAEHDKFLEGLKLFGRQWRKIEEHIGTKTAVQIRSHAQKFFSKLEKEAANKGGKAREDIAIPPPRPKRKPNHPYPRKADDSSSGGTGPGTNELMNSGMPRQMDLAAAAAAAASAALMRSSANTFLPGQYPPMPFQFPPILGMMQWPGLFGANAPADRLDPEATRKNVVPSSTETSMASFAQMVAMHHDKQVQGTFESSGVTPPSPYSKLGDFGVQNAPPNGPAPTFPNLFSGPGMLGFPASQSLSASSIPAGFEAQQAVFKSAFEKWFGSTMPFMLDPSQQQALSAAAVAATNAYATKGGAQGLADGTQGQVENNAAHAAAMAAAMMAVHHQDGQAVHTDHAKRRAERVTRLRQQKARRSVTRGSSLATSSAYEAGCEEPVRRENENQSAHGDNTSAEDKTNGNSNSGGQGREVSPTGDSGTTNERGPKSPSPEEAVMQNRYGSNGSGSLTAFYPSNGNGSGSGSDGNDGNQNAPRPRHGFVENRTTYWSSQREGNGSGSGSGSDGDDLQAGGLGKRGSSDKSSMAGSGSDEEIPLPRNCRSSEARYNNTAGPAESDGNTRLGKHKNSAHVPGPQNQERKRPKFGK